MVIVDVAVVNVALPAIKHDLHFSQESLQWVVTAYALLFGGALLLGGRLADLLGRRRMFMAGVAVFTLGSLLSGLAWSEGALIATRALQGLGGALLAPAALSIVVTTFREGRERNIALGVWGAASGSGGAVGVLLGGVLTSYLSWSWIFFVNLPIGVGRPRRRPVAHQREPGRGRAPALRRGRCHGDHGRPDDAGLRDHPHERARLERWRDGRAPRHRGCADRGVRRDRGALPRAAAAAADLPPADAVGGQRGDADDRRDVVRAVLPGHAVPAGGPALLGDRDGRRLHRDHRHDHRRRERRPGADHPAGPTTGADHRPAAHRGRRSALRPDARRRALLLERVPRAARQRVRARPLVRAGDDRRPHGRRARRRGRRLRADQHEPADRRLRRAGRGDDDRRHRDEPLRRRATACPPSAARRSRTGSRSRSTC